MKTLYTVTLNFQIRDALWRSLNDEQLAALSNLCEQLDPAAIVRDAIRDAGLDDIHLEEKS